MKKIITIFTIILLFRGAHLFCESAIDYCNKGIEYYKNYQYAEAIQYWIKAAELFEKAGDKQGEGATLHNIGGVYGDWGKYDEAIKHYTES